MGDLFVSQGVGRGNSWDPRATKLSSIRRIGLLLLCSMLSACASGFGPLSSGFGKSFEGLWVGRMITPNELTRKISVDVYQEKGQLRGQFRCAFGSTTCISNLYNGTVRGELDAPSFEVNLPDTSVCRFSGRFEQNRASGEYSCYLAAILFEHGSWELTRGDVLKDQL